MARENALRGVIKRSERGFALFRPEDGAPSLFIPKEALSSAQNGDKALVRKTGNRVRNGGSEDCGEVVRVLERANKRIVGYLALGENKDELAFIPSDKRVCNPLAIPKKRLNGAKAGDAAIVEVIDYEKRIGKVSEVLPPGSDVEAAALMYQYGVTAEFPAHVAAKAARVAQTVPKSEALRREDLRQRIIVTIDGADAKDLDDAVSLENLGGNRWLLGVHIADVCHYVSEGSALDTEALSRATSVYFPGFVAPMLPQELSNGICSLHGGVDRLALTCFMEIDRTGSVIDYRFAETLINTSARLTYDDVSAYLDAKTPQTRITKPVGKLLKDMERLAALLRGKRMKEGSIDFVTADTHVEMENGVPVKIEREQYGAANGIIEEFMLLCNQTVAKHMARLDLPCLYRVHETPDEAKLAEFYEFMHSVGLTMKKASELSPKLFQEALEKAKNTPEELVVSKQLLRLMKKARYCEDNLGHFGLSFSHYAHFTSPIRRYPDLLAHRALKLWLHGNLSGETLAKLRSKMPDYARKCSERERNAEEAERAMLDLRKCQYMSARVGETFEGIVSGFSNAGIFVALPDSVEGMIPFASIGGDYFEYDQKRLQAKGERSSRVIRLGDAAEIVVVAADLSTRRVEFAYAEGARRPRGTRRAKRIKTAAGEIARTPNKRRRSRRGGAGRRNKSDR